MYIATSCLMAQAILVVRYVHVVWHTQMSVCIVEDLVFVVCMCAGGYHSSNI